MTDDVKAPPHISFKPIVLRQLASICGCDNVRNANLCIKEITGGVFTNVAELDDPWIAERIHALLCDYAETPGNRVQGLALALEVGEAMGGVT